MDLDDYDGLYDLNDSDEYEDGPKRRKSTKGKGEAAAAGGYQIRHALKAPRATTYTTEALHKQMHHSDIELEPEYQREVVWPAAKQISLIDSIFRNFYIPPIIFAVQQDDEGAEKRVCIDGKQRLTSILLFMDGMIPHKDPLTGDKIWYIDNPTYNMRLAKKVLPERYKKIFQNKAIVCVEYTDLTPEEEREIFKRVQMGVALTPAEKLRVLSSPRADFLREIQENFLNNEDSSMCRASFEWDRSRGSDYRCLAQMFHCIAASPKASSMPQMEKWLSQEAPLAKPFRVDIENTFKVYETLVRLGVLNKVSPIEFITIGILIFRTKDALTLANLGAAVTAMRADVRSKHSDIRNNNAVYGTMHKFIESYQGPALGHGELSAQNSVLQGAGKTALGSKRKAARPLESDAEEAAEDSDADYVPAQKPSAPKKRAAKTTKSPMTPPMSMTPPSAVAAPSVVDVIRQAKEKIRAQATAASASASATSAATANKSASHSPRPPSPSLALSRRPGGALPPLSQQQSFNTVAAALEANLMSGTGPRRIKVELMKVEAEDNRTVS